MSFMQDENATMTSDDITPIPAAWILAFISGVSLFCNALNLLIIPTLKELADATKVFYVSLAIIDLVFTLLIIVMVKPSLTGKWEYGRLMCKVSGFLIGITSGSSATVVALLNVDRFAFIIKPLHYSRIVTTRRCVIAVAVMILLLVFVGVVEHVFAGDLFDIVRFREFGICLTDNRHRRFLPFTIFNFVIGYWSPALVILCLYVVILRTVWRHSKVIATQERIVDQLDGKCSRMSVVHSAGALSPFEKRSEKVRLLRSEHRRHLKSVAIAISITGSFILSWLPITISETIQPITGRPVARGYQIAFLYLACCSTWLDSLVYFVLNKEYRSNLKEILRRAKTMFLFLCFVKWSHRFKVSSDEDT
ncbi:rhodopsin, GQ-coupled-like [Diadema antillarum]|uniref:rhodopsin, GQ-coupled-like n=1 Tax=Diadema antillarum TaxID=105358 RepID=UPI003A84D721